MNLDGQPNTTSPGHVSAKASTLETNTFINTARTNDVTNMTTLPLSKILESDNTSNPINVAANNTTQPSTIISESDLNYNNNISSTLINDTTIVTSLPPSTIQELDLKSNNYTNNSQTNNTAIIESDFSCKNNISTFPINDTTHTINRSSSNSRLSDTNCSSNVKTPPITDSSNTPTLSPTVVQELDMNCKNNNTVPTDGGLSIASPFSTIIQESNLNYNNDFTATLINDTINRTNLSPSAIQEPNWDCDNNIKTPPITTENSTTTQLPSIVKGLDSTIIEESVLNCNNDFSTTLIKDTTNATNLSPLTIQEPNSCCDNIKTPPFTNATSTTTQSPSIVLGLNLNCNNNISTNPIDDAVSRTSQLSDTSCNLTNNATLSSASIKTPTFSCNNNINTSQIIHINHTMNLDTSTSKEPDLNCDNTIKTPPNSDATTKTTMSIADATIKTPELSTIQESHLNFNNNSTTKLNDKTNITTLTNFIIQQQDLKSNKDINISPCNFSFSNTYKPTLDDTNWNSHFDSMQPFNIYEFKSSTAFAVLNNDELTSQSDINKPNAIVHPIPRIEQLQVARTACPSFETNKDAMLSQQSLHRQKKHFPISSSKKMSNPPEKNNVESDDLRDKLNRKTRNLHATSSPDTWTNSRNSSNVSQQDHVAKRPLFITTVPTGVFLPPPKKPPIPWFLKPHIYAYSSHPMILVNKSGVSKVREKSKFRNSSAPSATIASSDRWYTLKAKRLTNSIANPNSKISTNISTSTPSLSGRRGGKTPSLTRNSLTAGVHLTKNPFPEQMQCRVKRDVPQQPYRNVMYDRRVIRGSVFGTQQLLQNSDPFDKAAEIRRRHAIRKQKVCRNQRNVLGTPPPVNGRRHEVIQTEKYLEELVQRPPEFSVDTQTDLFLEKPPEPPYVPAKVGVDVATEIGDGELFHFDAEAQPIIDILVDACIEQSILEVAHEQEIAVLRQKQAEFIAQREAELAELRRLEAEEIRLQAEKERRLQQEAIAKELHEEMQKSVTAAKLLQGHIAGLLPEVLDNLEPATDAAKKEHLMKTVAPWLTAEVAEEVGHIVDSREILTAIIKEIIKQRATAYAGYKEDRPLETVMERGEDDVIEEVMKEEVCTCESSDITSEKTEKCGELSKNE